MPAHGDLVLSLESMNAIERVDVPGRTLRAQAGAKLGNVQREAEKHGMVFPLDLGARDSATVGGNISTNAGGLRVLRYGMMRNLVLGIEAVLADGTVLTSLNRMLKNNAGYDLKQLFIGSEGTLGVVTRAELRLVSRTRSQETLLAALPTFEALVELLDRLDSGLGGQLAAFEALWGNYYDLNTAAPAQNAPPLPRGAPFYAIAETLGGDPEADRARLETVLGEAMEAGVVTDVTLANSETERRAIWNIREDVWQPKHIAPLLTFDVSLPIENMKAYVEEVNASVRAVRGREPLVRVRPHGRWQPAPGGRRRRRRRHARACRRHGVSAARRDRRLGIRRARHRPREAGLSTIVAHGRRKSPPCAR